VLIANPLVGLVFTVAYRHIRRRRPAAWRLTAPEGFRTTAK
jgi:hypothetical protein